MKTIKKISLLALFLAFVMVGCTGNAEGSLEVRMTDAPGDFEKVFVEVVAVEAHYEDTDGNKGDLDESGWVMLNTNAGIYDLLTLQNGIDTVLVPDQAVPAGYLGQMRLILGDENSVVVDGLTYPLALSSQDETGLKFNVNRSIERNEEAVVLFDFDAEKSIVLTGNGQYKLKPVIKVLNP